MRRDESGFLGRIGRAAGTKQRLRATPRRCRTVARIGRPMEWHFGKRRPSGADHEEQYPGLVGLDATLASRCRGASYPRSRPDLSRARRPVLKPLFSRAVRTVAWNAVRGCGCRSRAARLSVPERLPGRRGPAPVSRGPADRITQVRYVLPRHNAANWVGPGRGRRACRDCPRRRRLLRRESKAPLARHVTDCLGQAHGPGGRGVSA